MIGLYYTKCKHTPMINFVDALVNDNLQALYRWPFGYFFFKRKVKDAWDNLFTEYTDLIENDSISISFSLIKDIHYMHNKLFIINTCVFALRMKYNEKVIYILKKMGFNLKFTRESYLKDCNSVISRAKSIVADLANKEKEYSGMKKNSSVSEQNYIDMVYAISKSAGHRLSVREITVSEFCAAYNSYVREAKEMESQRNRRKSNG